MTQLLNKNKLVAIILCFTMLFSITSGIFTEAFAADETAANTHMVYDVTNGKDITLGHAQKATLTAQGGEQWQIYIYDADMWVDIAGKTGSSMELSYPLVASALTDRGTGELRCRLDDGSYSGIVNLVIDFSTESSYVKETEEEEVVVLTDTEELLEETDEELLEEEEVLDENQDEVLDENIDDPAEENTDENLDEDTTEETPADGTTEENTEQTTPDSTTDNKTTQEPVVQQPADTTTGEDNVTTPEPSNTQNGSSEPAAPETPKSETVTKEEPSLLDKLADGIKDKVSGAIDALKNFFKPDADEEEQDTKTPVVSEPEVKPAVTKSAQVTENAVTDEKSADNSVTNTVTEQTTFALTKPVGESSGDVEISSDDTLFEGSTDTSNVSGSSMQYALMTTEEDDEPKEPVYVIINYVFENNEIVADPYTAQLAVGSDFKAKVTFPTVQGYLPYVNTETESRAYIDLNYTNIQVGETITVTYKPTNVDYTVIHYKQNLENDNYTISLTETLQGLTGTTVLEVHKSYNGFYHLIYETPTIAADGSTVVEVYYDRWYYLMKFELNGGYGVDPIYAKYETPVSVGNPTRLGYTFNSWSPAVPSSVPYGGGTYTAQWTPNNETKYTVVYWGENANDTNYSYLDYAEKTAVSGTQVSGADDYTGNKTGFHFDHADRNIEVKGDGSTIVNVYYKRNTYTLIFAYDGGPVICDKHVHSADCYELTCGKEEHEHSYTSRKWISSGWGGYYNYYGGCYPASGAREGNEICGKDDHTHSWNQSCYGDTPICGQTGVTNHTHRVENGCYGMKFENVKYGADTSSLWSQAPAYRWKTTYDGDTAYTYAPAMPNSDLTVYGQTLKNSYQYTIHYYEQGTTTKVHADNVYYRSSNDYHLTTEDYISIPGFTCLASGSTYPDNNLVYTIYYSRNSYTLTFKNGSKETAGGTHLYEADISSKYFVPEYNGDEPEAYTFGGWYTTEQCVAGTQFNFTGAKMPYNNLILYAKWVPVTHTVDFYLNKTALESGEGAKLDSKTVAHGSKLIPAPTAPDNGNYTFIGWFYMENGEEKAFDFTNMPVNKNLQVYGKWSSNVLMPYVIYYKYQDTQESIAVPVALELKGSALAGTTKTFDAKGGSDLYADYREGYFPVVKSHSITIQMEETDAGTEEWYIVDAATNEKVQGYTFWYVQKDAVPYIVKYLDADTGESVAPTKIVNENRKAVVTEKFVQVKGMMPDAYQKRLVVSGEAGAVNEIIFYYTKDEKHAYYRITHYTQNTDGENWTEYATSEAVGTIGEPYSASPMTIDGFSYVEGYEDENVKEVKSGNLTENGLDLKLYYVRKEYPYQVRYLEEGTGNQLHEPKNGKGLYGKIISESAIDIMGYDKVNPTSQTLSIKIEQSQTEAKLNIITFYYKEKVVPITYTVVGPDGSGTVKLNQEGAATDTQVTENVKVLSGTAVGATAAPSSPTYKFTGWYSDAACANNQLLSTDVNFVPQKNSTTDVYEAKTYYAKFELNVADLTIRKTGWNPVDAGQTFIFDVTGPNGYNNRVVIEGNGSVTIKDLLIGEYTVTENTDWSWRYEPEGDVASQKITLSANGTNTVTFNNTREHGNWIDGNTSAENVFTFTNENNVAVRREDDNGMEGGNL